VARLTGARNVLAATARPAADGGCEVTLADGLVLRAACSARGAVTAIVRADAIVARLVGAGEGTGPAGATGLVGAAGSLPAAGANVDAAAGHAASDPRLADNVVAARVVDVRPTATGRLVAVDVGGLTVLVPRAYDHGFRPAPGAAVELVIPAAAVHVVPASPVDAALASSVDGAPASPVDGAPPSPPAHSPIVNLSR
jgi:hypothetical protein